MPRDAAPALRFLPGAARNTSLGADYDGEGTNFALFSDHATRVELALYDDSGRAEVFRQDLPEMAGGIWHGYLPGVRPGQLYGYRVHGPWAPHEGHRFNPAKLLLDPYAREISGELIWDDALFGHAIGGEDTAADPRDSAPFIPKGVVTDPDFDWEADRALKHPWENLLVYEAHVKGLTMRHPEIPEADRGTFAGLASGAVIEHLKDIGVTAIELMPVQGFIDDRHLVEKGLRNYWGYNTLSFFAPHRPYLRTGLAREMKQAIRRFHAAGIEVYLDVVYNHTAEGSEKGPTLSFRGIDNASYYLLAEDPRHTFDVTGTGNTLNIRHPMVLRMVLDSLRYWVQVMHVDGFRFDLASTLGREATGFEREGAFFATLRQDPVLAQVKLIAEPWDVGDGGYQVGGFPWPFREWNDKARDDIRAFWRRDPGMAPRLTQRLVGSPVQFDHSHRPATSSVNFVAAHDGFTLWDTVSYNHTHNEANGEGGADGHAHNLSDNMGVEGPGDDPALVQARQRRVKAMLATVLVSQGIPMILAGDEAGHSQQGNNNAYCQDNETSWIDWQAARPELVAAVRDLMAFRRAGGGLARTRFAKGPEEAGTERPQVVWLHPAGREMAAEDWDDAGLRVLGMALALPGRGPVLMLFNAGEDCRFALPEGRWRRVIDTARDPVACDEPEQGEAGLGWQSVAALVPEG